MGVCIHSFLGQDIPSFVYSKSLIISHIGELFEWVLVTTEILENVTIPKRSCVVPIHRLYYWERADILAMSGGKSTEILVKTLESKSVTSLLLLQYYR